MILIVTLNLKSSFYEYIKLAQSYQFFDIRNVLKLKLKVFENINRTSSTSTLSKEFVFIFDCATKYSLYNPKILLRLR